MTSFRPIRFGYALIILLFVQVGDSDSISAQDLLNFLEPGAKVQKLAGGMKFTEGPVWLPNEKILVFSDIPNSKLMQWSEEGGLSEYRKSKQSNGNILDAQGRIISCQHAGRNVIRIEKDGSETVLVDNYENQKYNSPNDVAVHPNGTIWFTDPSWGLKGKPELPGHWVFKFDPATQKTEAIVKDLPMPNGIVFSPDFKKLFISDTGGNKRHPDKAFHKLPASIRCYAITKEGTIGELLFTIKNVGSDGMAVDQQGNLYLTWGGKVQIYNADGKKLAEIPTPEGPANVCFGGEDYKTLFITARTSLYSIRMKNAGARLPAKRKTD